MNDEARYAVLIDAENVSPKYIQIIFDEVSNYGLTTYRRIYGDWTSNENSGWKSTLLDASITPIQQYTYTSGKNASDSALIIDAMDILYTMSVDGFVLVSSDSDFTRLASRLRESGMHVIGMGESKTPSAFIAACNSFKYLDVLYDSSREGKEEEEREEEPTTAKPSSNRKSPSPNNRTHSKSSKSKAGTSISIIKRSINNIIQENSDEEGMISLANLGNQLVKRHPDFDVRNYGYTKLASFIPTVKNVKLEARKNSKDGANQLFVKLK